VPGGAHFTPGAIRFHSQQIHRHLKQGGAVETRHPGRLSKLDKSLCEIVGRLMSKPAIGRQVAVMPRTQVTLRLARKLAPRCANAGISIALVGPRGEVEGLTEKPGSLLVRRDGQIEGDTPPRCSRATRRTSYGGAWQAH